MTVIETLCGANQVFRVVCFSRHQAYLIVIRHIYQRKIFTGIRIHATALSTKVMSVIIMYNTVWFDSAQFVQFRSFNLLVGCPEYGKITLFFIDVTTTLWVNIATWNPTNNARPKLLWGVAQCMNRNVWIESIILRYLPKYMKIEMGEPLFMGASNPKIKREVLNRVYCILMIFKFRIQHLIDQILILIPALK